MTPLPRYRFHDAPSPMNAAKIGLRGISTPAPCVPAKARGAATKSRISPKVRDEAPELGERNGARKLVGTFPPGSYITQQDQDGFHVWLVEPQAPTPAPTTGAAAGIAAARDVRTQMDKIAAIGARYRSFWAER